MENYKFCNLILKKQYNITVNDYYKLYYILLSDNINVKLSKNCLIFNSFNVNVKLFVNGVLTLTGIKTNVITKSVIDEYGEKLDNFLISNLEKKLNLDLQKYDELYIQEISNVGFLINKENLFVGLKTKEKISINNIPVERIKINDEICYISCNNKNKYKRLFKSGKLYGLINYEPFNSKKFFYNSTIEFDYSNKVIYSKGKIIGDINIKEHKITKQQCKESDFSIVSCNIQFKLNKKINRYRLFNNLINNNFVAEYKLLEYSAVSLFFDNVTVSVFKSGDVIIKGLSNNSKVKSISDYVNDIKNIIVLNI